MEDSSHNPTSEVYVMYTSTNNAQKLDIYLQDNYYYRLTLQELEDYSEQARLQEYDSSKEEMSARDAGEKYNKTQP